MRFTVKMNKIASLLAITWVLGSRLVYHSFVTGKEKS